MVKLSLLLSFLNQIKIFHWQTESFAEHKALNKAYGNLDDLFDRFIEICIGKVGRPEQNIQYEFKATRYQPEILVPTIKSYRSQILQHFDEILDSDSDRDLMNIRDDIQGEINHLLYLLTLK